ncbi:hypothetical protein C8N43_3338 [Litoreibacter ponti]|uniref:2-oxoglutarate-Fe(II)-dependent oxygenase superfamily protein n=1 Tax=Litoreibacter ponti TaxID=1510457 RepID=A0A2T6BEN7_9RHOB|nr:hypothetical protein [Litoreibacter ponti]PTX54523.1 hypothetical protein C8N43_3338 [Litoreibacter ponti]
MRRLAERHDTTDVLVGRRPPPSPLIQAGGALVIPDLLSGGWFKALRREGLANRANATEQKKDHSDPGDWRTGDPARYLASAEAGPILDQIYADRGLISKLSGLAGGRLQPTGTRGSFSYYDRPGHFLGLHRDIKTCDVTLITCLERTEGTKPSGALRLYSKFFRAPLERVDRRGPHRDVNMKAGQSVLLLGGCIPHEVLPAAQGYRRAISVLCFEM